MNNDPKALASAARASVVELFRMVHAGNADAARELVQLIAGAVESLTYATDPHGVLRAEGRKRSWWPVLGFAREKDGENYLRAVVSRFEVGADCGLKLGGKKADIKTPETGAAMILYQNVEMDRQRGLKLPPLSRDKKTLARWWKECERVFPKIFGDDFENRPEFARWKGKKHSTINKKGERVKTDEPLDLWEIRREIKKKIRQSLVSLAP